MKKQIFTVPVWALSYLANGDKSGISLYDLKNCRTFQQQNKIVGFLSADGEEFEAVAGNPWYIFTRCTVATFHVRYTSDELFNRIVCRVDGSRGAPMGRSSKLVPVDKYGLSDHTKNPVSWDFTPHFDRRVLLDSGAYDRGGAYWGFPGNVRVRFSKDGQYWQFYRTGDKI